MDKETLNKQLIEFDLSVRAINCLNQNKIYTLGDLAKITLRDIRRIRNIGEKTIQECESLLSDNGLIFGMDEPVEIVSKKTWIIEIVRYSNGEMKMNRRNDGFSAHELLGLMVEVQNDIIRQLNGDVNYKVERILVQKD